MLCDRCQCEGELYRQINSSGAKVIVERCPICRRAPNIKQAFISKKGLDWDALPLFEDYSLHAEPCAVRGCLNKGTEYHHFSPRHLFDDADDWPTAYLCKVHHTMWHKITRTGSYYGNNETGTKLHRKGLERIPVQD